MCVPVEVIGQLWVLVVAFLFETGHFPVHPMLADLRTSRDSCFCLPSCYRNTGVTGVCYYFLLYMSSGAQTQVFLLANTLSAEPPSQLM